MSDTPQRHIGSSRPLTAIFWISLLGLFLELLLIRWVGTEIRIFAYLQNTVLVVCFLGLGVGCFTARQPIRAEGVLIRLVVLVGLLAVPITRKGLASISDLLSTLGDINIWRFTITQGPMQTALSVALGLAMTFFIMVLIVEVFVPVGRLLGRLMDDHPRTIQAYSVNVAGSLAGTWLFVGLSVLDQPPVVWFAVLAILLVPFFVRSRPRRWIDFSLLGSIVLLSWWSGHGGGVARTIWSPYQKLALIDRNDLRAAKRQNHQWERGDVAHRYIVEVNNVGYQLIADLRPETVAGDPEKFPADQIGFSQYDIPCLLHPAAKDMLIVGSGTGNDVAGALRHGVPRITAVEIDPAIIELGRRYHPERPYESDRVRVITDDARSFFAATDRKYDLISFGLLDSHTTTAMTNARLDHYVYTRESLTRARALLRKGGVVCLSFEPQRPFIADRIARVLRDVFGRKPLVFRVPSNSFGWGGVMFVAGDLDAVQARIRGNEHLAGLIGRWQSMFPVKLTYAAPVATDDWPYIYLRRPMIPPLYVLLAGLTVLLVGYLRWVSSVRVRINPIQWRRSDWHFFCLGAAFLLLEVQNISKSAVVLGNTWWVNAVIISGVLSMVLLANVIVAGWKGIWMAPVWLALCGTVLGLYFIDLARFAFLPYATKAVLVGGLTTLPMLFGGIVFIRSFAATERKDIALGANLMGALVGAMLQSLSFLLGIKALLLLVLGFYLLAALTRPIRPTSEAPAPVGAACGTS